MKNIPTHVHMEAYKAAAAVPFFNDRGEEVLGSLPHSAHIAAALEAVAPLIAAQAWDEGYSSGRSDVQDEIESGEPLEAENPYKEAT